MKDDDKYEAVDKDELISMLTELVTRQSRIIASLQREKQEIEAYAWRLERKRVAEFLRENDLIGDEDGVDPGIIYAGWCSGACESLYNPP